MYPYGNRLGSAASAGGVSHGRILDTVEREDIEYFGLDEPDEMDPLSFKILYRDGMERKAVPYVVVEVDYADNFYGDRHMAADYCPLL